MILILSNCSILSKLSNCAILSAHSNASILSRRADRSVLDRPSASTSFGVVPDHGDVDLCPELDPAGRRGDPEREHGGGIDRCTSWLAIV